MKKLIGILFLAASSTVWAGTGYRIVYDVTVKNGGETATIESSYMLQDQSVRFESSGSMMPMGKMVMVRNPKMKGFVMLMEGQKSYMEMPVPDAKAVAEAKTKQVPFKATGKTKKIGKYSCDVFERSVEGRKEEACTSKELAKALTELEKSTPKGPGGEGSGLPSGLSGLPIEFTVKKAVDPTNTVEQEMKLKEYKEEKLADALFEIPKDYTKQTMSFGGMQAPPSSVKPKTTKKK
ncbi:MAG: DUF4412 domain-containing protein [Pseudomonadota bacterium]